MKKSVIVLIMSLLLITCFPVSPISAEEAYTEPMAYFNFDGEEPFVGENEYEIVPYVMDGSDIDYDDVDVELVEGMQGFGKAGKLCMPDSPENSIFLRMDANLFSDIANDDFTISFWFYGADGVFETTPLALGYTMLNPFLLFEINNAKEVCLVYCDAEGVIQRAVGAGSGIDVTQGWHMYTLAVTRGDNFDTLNYYIDGNLIVCKNDTKLPKYGECENDNAFNYVGKSFWGQPTASGLIDEIRFYDVALSETAIAQLKIAPKVEETITPSPTETMDKTPAPTPTPTETMEETFVPTPGESSLKEENTMPWGIVGIVFGVVVVGLIVFVMIKKKEKK